MAEAEEKRPEDQPEDKPEAPKPAPEEAAASPERPAPHKKKHRHFVQFTDPAIAKKMLFVLAAVVLVLWPTTYRWPVVGAVLRGLRNNSYDLMLRANEAFRSATGQLHVPPRDVMIVGIDDHSLEKYGRWPWKRSLLADLIDGMKELGVKTVAMDVLFSEPQYSPLEGLGKVLEQLPEEVRTDARFSHLQDLTLLEERLDELPDDLSGAPGVEEVRRRLLPPWEDEILVRSVERSGNVVLGMIAERGDDLQGSLSWVNEYKAPRPPVNAVDVLRHRGVDFSEEELNEAWREGLFPGIFIEDGRPFPLVRLGTFGGQELEDALRSRGIPAATVGSRESLSLGAKITIRTASDQFMAGGLTLPLAPLLLKASGGGFMNDQVSADAVARKLPLAMLFDSFGVPSLVLAALANYYEGAVELEVEESGLVAGMRVVRTDASGRRHVVNRFRCGQDMEMWVNYYGSKVDRMTTRSGRTFERVVPVMDVLQAARILDLKHDPRFQGEENKAARQREVEKLRRLLQGRIAFVGATALGTTDIRVTPLGDFQPGVLAHASLAANILEGRTILHRDREMGITILSVMLFLAVQAFLLPRLKALTAFFFTIWLILIAFFWCWVCLRNGSVIFPFEFLYPLIVFFGLGMAYLNRIENKEKAWLDGMFKRYVSPEYIEQIKANKGQLDLEGKEAIITPFFSDMAKFSTISEAFSAEGLFRFLGEYLGEMADILDEYRGTLDKFEGDAVVAFFGAPIHYEEHALKACLASIRMQERILELERDWQVSDRYPELHALERKIGHWFPIRVRIGLNTGPCATGHLGTAERGNYTMMGDTVNLAARLEAAGKQYGIVLTISDDTRKAAGDRIITRPVDVIQVVGRTVGTKIFEVIGEADRVPEERMKFNRMCQDAFAFYSDREFEKARDLYVRARELRYDDRVSEIFIGRCEAFLATPPPEDWDGVYVLTEK